MKDYTGLTQGKLTIIGPTGHVDNTKAKIWRFHCECGKEFERTYRSSLQSCGCSNSGRFSGVDYTGHRLGKVTVLRDSGKRNSKGYIIWDCQCDCGHSFQRPSYSFTRGTCTQCELCTRKSTSERVRIAPPVAGWKKDAQYRPGRFHPIHRLFARYKTSAKQRKITFDLAKQEMYNLCSQPCHYCGITDANLLGIDRIDSREGYTPDNSVSCCTICNRAKSNMDVTAFESWILMASKHIQGRSLT